MARQSCIPHGKNEVLVAFEEDGEMRNHLLRDAGALVERYVAHEASAKSRRQELDQTIASERNAIDEDAFVAAEAAIADAARLAAEREGAGNG